MNTYVMMIGHEWYAFAGNLRDNQVYSIGKDNPPKSNPVADCYFASFNEGAGVPWVAKPSPNRKAAVSKAKRHGDYSGELVDPDGPRWHSMMYDGRFSRIKH